MWTISGRLESSYPRWSSENETEPTHSSRGGGPLEYTRVPTARLEPPPGWHGSLPTMFGRRFEAHVAGGWHDHAPGETRVRLPTRDPCHLTTQKTLSGLRRTPAGKKDRFDHHAGRNISAAELPARVLNRGLQVMY